MHKEAPQLIRGCYFVGAHGLEPQTLPTVKSGGSKQMSYAAKMFSKN